MAEIDKVFANWVGQKKLKIYTNAGLENLSSST
jgi:hypothetical protein